MDFGVRNKEGKSEFKDLQEGYLNFFGVCLRDNISSSEKKKKLRVCRSQSQLKTIMGENILNKQIQSFDDMNQKLISVCYDQLDRLSSLLGPSHKELILILKSWVKILYFR